MMNSPSKKPVDLADIRARLANQQGRQYWRSLEELAETEQFQDYLHREFPKHASEWHEALDRRQFVALMGASLALGGVTGCRFDDPPEKIVPYVDQPEALIPGRPKFYATAMPNGAGAIGLLAESHMGRPTKLEGNPAHPASLGSTDGFAQASILTMYDPDRAQTAKHLGEINTWETMLIELRAALAVQRSRQGRGLCILTEPFSSPTLGRQMTELFEQFPEARWFVHDPLDSPGAREAAEKVFGRPINLVPHFEKANVVLSLDADFLSSGANSVRSARDYSQRRRVRGEKVEMNRLYVVESTPTNTGAAADHRLPLPAGEIELFARRLAAALGVLENAEFPAGEAVDFNPEAKESDKKLLEALAGDLRSNEGASLVVAGPNQPAAVHALVHAINQTLNNVGKTLDYTAPLQTGPIERIRTLPQLTQELAGGQVELLLILGSNPVYTAPAELEFAKHLTNAELAIAMGLYFDETAQLCQWHLPQSYYLEAWSDVRAWDGTAAIVQPLIAPLYETRSFHELLSAVVDQAVQTPYDAVRATWQPFYEGQDSKEQPTFEKFWLSAVHDGVIPKTELEKLTVEARLPAEMAQPSRALAPAADEIEIIFQADPTIGDGRWANNGWLQELPKAISKLTWDNAALVSPALAEKLGVKQEDVVRLTYNGRSVEAPVWIMIGQPARSVTVYLGYGRQAAGRVGNKIGFNAYQLRTSDQPWFNWGLDVEKLSKRYPLATTQDHHSMEGRNLVRSGTIEQFEQNPDFVRQMDHVHEPIPTLYPLVEYNGFKWGMAIDLSTCFGCSACVVACQAENNIPVVGKSGVLRGREMQWLRIDRYFAGDDLSNPQVLYQPMLCQHCETAPCETVCPVAATTHSPEGLNEMTYNRCVGTRYCSNNCPYKVRRFNFFNYTTPPEAPVLELLYNPDVTVRSRGVMEKCTYCVQRINTARIAAKVDAAYGEEKVKIPAGGVVTACQQVCPSQAIVFGDLNNPEEEVSQLKALPTNYGVLAELGTLPRTTYLAQIKNPHPSLAPAIPIDPHHAAPHHAEEHA